ncbi:MAG TPA: hypothetical protein VGR73_12565 [Bryobacteraceae bacterium]|nr:hypothetical protein [Bryobacteraceae bacterium]
MLGELIGETKGKRLLRRVLSSEPLTAEVSFEESGNLFGVAYSGFGSYTATARPDGTVYGEGQGVAMTVEGEAVTWKGSGLGKLGAGGAISYRGILYFRTASQKLARLNNAPGVFEYEVDAAGNTTNKIWEWK